MTPAIAGAEKSLKNAMGSSTRQRVSAVIIENGQLLLIHRVKPGRDYYVLPGGGIEPGETKEEALQREVREELHLEVTQSESLFCLADQFAAAYDNTHNGNKEDFYFLISTTGTPEIGGPEKERMTATNTYTIHWAPLADLASVSPIYPVVVVPTLLKSLRERQLV